jgi:hypothetical protein
MIKCVKVICPLKFVPIVKDHLTGGKSGKGTGRKYATALNAAELKER